MKPIIKLRPERAFLNLSTISQSMKEISAKDVSSCPRACRTRLMHDLVIRNNNFSIKHIFTLKYRTDCDSALICLTNEPCKRTVMREFPGRQSYWSGEKKTLSELVCWCASRTERDFNLEIELSDQAFSAGIEQRIIEQLNEEVMPR